MIGRRQSRTGAPRRRRGFSLTEVMIAIIVLAAGLLGLAGGTSLAARMAGRGAKAGTAVAFASQRLEILRPQACTVRNSGSEDLTRNGRVLASNTWTWTDRGNSTYHLRVVTAYTASAGLTQTFTSEESFSCQP